ncbi:agmatine deiminase family protein [Pseudonocardiaceae bacterium YIM PH 21723]|nr:agmatine deiminase family protein [Pseudonocardiaceae bacterium YIM PH 21723]
MPAETDRHERTFMAWPASRRIWGSYLRDVQQDIVELARVIARFEPVALLAAPDLAGEVGNRCGNSVEVLPIPTDDLWARDTAPTFLRTDQGIVGLDTNFNGWGNKQRHPHDALLATRLLAHLGIPRLQAPLVTEGGSLEVDGDGTLLITESSIVNPNRNPGKPRDQVERELKAMLGVHRVVWFPGEIGADITDFHVDGLARFTEDGRVLINTPASSTDLEILRANGFSTVELPEPDWDKIGDHGDDFLASYINYYLVNDAVIAPAFGDRAADEYAVAVLSDAYPGRAVVQVRIDHLAEGGGGIHCATQQLPA